MTLENAIRVGDISVTPFLDGTARLTPAMFTANGAPADWSAHLHLFDDSGNLTVPVGAFLVRTGDEVILLDAGAGRLHDEMFDCGSLLQNLSAAGIRPNDITKVVITHLHADHFGWVEQDGHTTFPRATIHIGAADWRYFVDEAQGGRKRAARLLSIADHVLTINHDGESLGRGVTARATPGHTPGHTSVVVSSGTDRLIVLGDALHCPAQLEESEWQFLYDVDGDLAARTRAAVLREAEVPNTTLLPCHFPGMVGARLIQGTGKRRWVLG